MVASEHNDLSNLDFTYTNSVIAEDELVTFSWIHSEASDGPSVYSSAGTTIEIPSTVITCTLNLEIYSCVSNDEVLIKPDAVISISVQHRFKRYFRFRG